MTETRDIRSLLLKAARIVLVFALVFYTSLNVELMIAYGVDKNNYPSVTADDGKAHEADELTDLVVYQRSEGQDAWKPVADLKATAPASPVIEVPLEADAPKQQFVAVPVWNDKYPDGYKEGNPLESLASAMFVKWTVGETPEDPQPEKNVLVFTPEPGQTTKISCKLDPADERRTENLSLAFTVKVADPAVDTKPKIASASFFYSEAQAATAIGLRKNDLPKNLSFQAELTFKNADSLPKATYSSAEDGLLSNWSKNEETGESAFGDLVWSIEPVEPAEIGDLEASFDKEGKGILTLNKELLQGKSGCQFKVNCSVDGISLSEYGGAVVTVTVGKPGALTPEEIQGEADPQPTLRVEVDEPLLKADGGTSASDSANADGDTAVADGMVKVDQTYEFDAETGTMKGLKEGTDLAFSTDTREMYSSMNGGSVNIKGHGFELKDLIQDAFDQAGVDFDTAPVESVELIGRDDKPAATIPYGDIKDPDKFSIMMATESRVLVDSEDAEGGEAAENAAESEGTKTDELLSNTRFRPIIKQATPSESLDADDLRWIKEVHLKAKKQDQKDDVEVWIDYSRVPMGVDAEFVAVPTHHIKGSWTFQWYEWKKGTSDWTRMDEEGQTLRVPTIEEKVGNRYMVTIVNEDPSAGESKGGTSKPVELQPLGKDEWSVVLSYNPPVAGNMAIFKAKVYQYKGDSSKLRYTWRWSNDGGNTWSKIDPETRKDEHVIGEPYSTQSTLKMPTTAPTDASDDSPNILYYIRVDVTIGESDDDLHESNVQPLTVHPGEENTDKPSGKDDDDPKKKDTDDDNNDKKNTEVNITKDSNYSDSDDNDLSNIVVDDDVSDIIKEQEKAANEKAAETIPGARWTQLKTMEKPGDETRRVLSDNPFAPFAIPLGLGITAAGGLEKILFFRRQL